MTNNEIMVAREDVASVNMLDMLKNTDSAFMSTIVDDGTRESKVAIYNAVNGDGENLSDHIGKVINVENYVAHPVSLVDPKTGEVTEALRIVLVTTEGECYASVSTGVLSSLQKICGIMGAAPWTGGNPMKATKVKTRSGYETITLTLV